MIVERVSGKPLKKRTYVSDDQLKAWCGTKPKDIELQDLPQQMKERLATYSAEILTSVIQTNVKDIRSAEDMKAL